MPHCHHHHNGHRADHHNRNHHHKKQGKGGLDHRPHEKPNPKPLRFQIVSLSIPHPEKLYKHGEDASFVHHRVLGVYDGVGGWAKDGVDAGRYSKGLARVTERRYHDRFNDGKTIAEALQYAVKKVRHEGSSTACAAELVGDHLKGVNIGDSGLMVARDGKMEYSTVPQNKKFNQPHQVSFDDPSDLDLAEVIDVPLRDGDIVVAASDGLWDNSYRNHITHIIEHHVSHWKQCDRNPKVAEMRSATKKFRNNLHYMKEHERYPKGKDSIGGSRLIELACDIGRKACRVAHSSSARSPFSDHCAAVGRPRAGGKLDDITIVVARVVRTNDRFTASFEGTCPSCR